MTINNTNVKNLLTANNKGIGKTDLLPDTYSFDADNNFIVKNVGTALVTTDLIAAKFIQLFHSFLKDMPLEKKQDHLKALAVNCIDLNQYKSLFKPEKAAKQATILDEKLLTPDQYKRNCVKIALATIDADAIMELFVIPQVKNLLFTEEQELTYLTMIENAEIEAKKWEGITDLGFTNVLALKDGSVQASISFAEVSLALPGLTKLGYVLIKSTPVMDTMSITVVFKAGIAEKLA
jgi:hypothetical protein